VNRREFIKTGAVALAGLSLGSRVIAKQRHTTISGLGMPPFETTLMGVLKGAADHYRLNISAPMVFGASGHAFLINIAKDICPSSPYVWQRKKINPLTENIGLRMIDLGFHDARNDREDRTKVEETLREALDKGIVCSLINLENQMITGYDDIGFSTVQPWARKDFPPARLTYGSWAELGKQFHVTFYILEQVKQSGPLAAILDSLDYAVDLHKNPSDHSVNGYGIGPDAYTNWIKAVPQYGASHGNWWNATVWSECRAMAARYFAEMGKRHSHAVQLTVRLEKAYADMAATLKTLGNKGMDTSKKVDLLVETKDSESKAIKLVADLAALLRTSVRG